DAFGPNEAVPTVVYGRVERSEDPRGYRATVGLLQEGRVVGGREVFVAGNDCRRLDDALVVVMSVALQTSLESVQAGARSAASDASAAHARDRSRETAQTQRRSPAAISIDDPEPPAGGAPASAVDLQA